ncbi:hypothetical protein WN48_09817 [Eufriesea mexicana]|uniref:Uncharacterized protein n=1 Tax=Eufriesea mexicana TaxID=516756 RepID=A0A310SGX7_9HYME|nr:hypothetical protein WN48_09817 [Eufriesea mexicana]
MILGLMMAIVLNLYSTQPKLSILFYETRPVKSEKNAVRQGHKELRRRMFSSRYILNFRMAVLIVGDW